MLLAPQSNMIEKCLRCSRTLTNPVSMYVGFGPICSAYLGIERPEYEELLKLNPEDNEQLSKLLAARQKLEAANNIEGSVKLDNDKIIIEFEWECTDFYKIKDTAKSLGAKWNATDKQWVADKTRGREIAEALQKFPNLAIDEELFNLEKPTLFPLPTSGYCKLIGDYLAISFTLGTPNFTKMKDAIKSLGAKWNPDKKIWTYPINFEKANQVITTLKKYGIEISNEIQAILDNMDVEKGKSREMSNATSADIEIAGLNGTLYPFQKAGVAYAIQKERVLIADEMGLGKSIEAIAWLQSQNAFPAIIVVPASLKLNWQREINKWLPEKKVIILSGTGKNGDVHAENYAIDNSDITVINYDILVPRLEQLKERGFKAVVLDECFPYNTPVITDTGILPIGFIVENKLPVRVLSCDLSSLKLEYKPIDRYIKHRQQSNLVKVTCDVTSFICTGHHKIFTEEYGYVEAQNLPQGSILRGVPDSLFTCGPQSDILFSEMQNKSGVSTSEASHQNLRTLWEEIRDEKNRYPFLQSELFRKMEQQLTRSEKCPIKSLPQRTNYLDLQMVSEGFQCHPPFEKQETVLLQQLCSKMENKPAIYQRKDIYPCKEPKSFPIQNREAQLRRIQMVDESKPRPRVHEKGDRRLKEIPQKQPQFLEAGWQTTHYRTANAIMDGFRLSERMVGIPNSNREKSEKGIGNDRQYVDMPSTLLLSRHCASAVQNCDRSRWCIPQNKELEMDRRTQRESFEHVRVDSIEILERGDYKKHGISCKKNNKVYNLEVKDNHNYFAHGILVSNSHYIKNKDAGRTKATLELRKGIPLRMCLTGTPILNRPNELIQPLSFLGRLNELGGFWSYCKRFCAAKQTPWGWDMSGASNLTELNRKLRETCMVRRRKQDVLQELPDKQRVFIPVELEEISRIKYNDVVTNFAFWLEEYRGKKLEEKAKTMPPGAVLETTWLTRPEFNPPYPEQLVKIEVLKQLAAKGKLNTVKEWISDFLETGEKLVVFAHHKEIIAELANSYPDEKRAVLVGDTTMPNRQVAVDQFQTDPNCQLFIGSMKAAGVGITLTAASNVAFVELGWTPADHEQAEDRTHRIGQKDAVTAWYFIAENTIENDIYNLILSKRGVVNMTTDGTIETNVIEKVVQKLIGELGRRM